MKILNLNCTRCKKKLTEHEGRYCNVCVRTMDADKKRRAETDTIRPCKECGVDLINPAPNRKWCVTCSKKRTKEAEKEQSKRRSAERKIMTELRRTKMPSNCRVKDENYDRYKGTVNPMFLVRGKISNSNIISAMGA